MLGKIHINCFLFEIMSWAELAEPKLNLKKPEKTDEKKSIPETLLHIFLAVTLESRKTKRTNSWLPSANLWK